MKHYNQIEESRLYKVWEAADALDVTNQTIRKYIKAGHLEGMRQGRSIDITGKSLKKFLMAQTSS